MDNITTKSESDKKAKKSGRAHKGLPLSAFYFVSLFFLLLFNLFVCRLGFVHGPSMEPTLFDGDIVVIWQPFYQPQAGDIVVTNDSNELHTVLVKRVLAVAGQHVEIRENQIYVDGVRQPQPTAVPATFTMPPLSLVVPEGEVFLLGDNWPASKDSRDIGCIPVSGVVGKVLFAIPLHIFAVSSLPAQTIKKILPGQNLFYGFLPFTIKQQARLPQNRYHCEIRNREKRPC